MSLADRDYSQTPDRRGGMMSGLTPVVKALLITNIAVFVLDYLILSPALGYPPLITYGAFSIDSAIQHLHVWEFITFQFLHGGFLHIFFNSMGIYYFGPWIERHLGSRKFLLFYLLCGAAGAAFFTLLATVGLLHDAQQAALVGASAGIYGIFAGIALIAPNLRVMLIFPPVELSMRQLAIALLGIATAVILFNLHNAGGEAGHLGGALLGFFLIRYPNLLGGGPKVTIHPPRWPSRNWQSKLKPRTSVDLQQQSEVDAILDKISREGFQSLTETEKQTLKRAAER